MAKKQYFITIDSETTIKDRVADFAAVVTDRKGVIQTQCAILVKDIFGVESLFYDKNASGIWSSKSVAQRTDAYNQMLSSGIRMMASVNAINKWLAQAQGKYNPILTAYNLAFDASKCQNTGIDLNGFADRFCLWGAAVGNICNTKKYKDFVLQNHLFNTPTEKGNMSFSTTAEAVSAFMRGQFTDEPHTALEDIIGWELPILVHVLGKRNWRDNLTAYNWRSHQVKDHYAAR